MSGICGFMSLDGRPVPRDEVQRMLDKLAHLGPDGHGIWTGEPVALGQQTMHLTPESQSDRLPACHGESGSVLVLDGRLDNRKDLLRQLNLLHQSELPDSALIRAAYERWDIDFAAQLIGEFACALWDPGRGRLICVTDPIGVRPLYYRELAGGFFAFASEVPALLELGSASRSINQRRLALLGVSALTVLLEPELTCFESVYRVRPGTLTVVSRQGRSVRSYWEPDFRKRLRFRSEAECGEAFLEVFQAAVRARLRSIGPVASLLSGGLDSSAIVGAASRLQADDGKRLLTLSAVTEPEAAQTIAGERHFIELFRGNPDLDMLFVSAPGEGPFDRLDDLVASGSLCSYSYQHFLYSALSETARKNEVRIILDGHGGELSASVSPQGWLAELLLRGRWASLWQEIRRPTKSDNGAWRRFRQQVVRPILPYSVLSVFGRHPRFQQLFRYPVRPGFVADVLGSDVEAITQQLHRLRAERPDHRRNMARAIQLERNDIRQRSHAGFLGYQHARYSYPYLDRRVLEFAMAVDGQFKQRSGHSRLLLRRNLAGRVPTEILSRQTKAPFCPDYHLRYERSRPGLSRRFNAFADSPEVREIVDFDSIHRALGQAAEYRAELPTAVQYETQFLVPYAMYLCYFLRHFGV